MKMDFFGDNNWLSVRFQYDPITYSPHRVTPPTNRRVVHRSPSTLLTAWGKGINDDVYVYVTVAGYIPSNDNTWHRQNARSYTLQAHPAGIVCCHTTSAIGSRTAEVSPEPAWYLSARPFCARAHKQSVRELRGYPILLLCPTILCI